jgi:hypothetical protein
MQGHQGPQSDSAHASMKTRKIASLLVLSLGFVLACQAADNPNSNRKKEAALPSPDASTNMIPYVVRAWGPNNLARLTNAPKSNRVAISLATGGGSDAAPIFRLTNREPHAILLTNVRVQTRSTGRGTDGFGWDTVYDDYPMGTPRFNTSVCPPNSPGEVAVAHPGKAPWRVCIIYSIDWSDSGNSYGGNYEVISGELKE